MATTATATITLRRSRFSDLAVARRWREVLVLAAITALTSIGSSQGIVSPEVSADGRVTFRVKAPDAKQVLVHCEGVQASAMEKNSQGIWSLTSEPLEPDIYSYAFQIDGSRVIDPNNPLLKYNLLNTDSQVHVPGPSSLLWEVNDVPRGTLHRHFYRSSLAGDERDFYVYTPPGYNPASGKRYPVLYLLHGYSDDASAWSSVGLANVILDNLIARKQAVPMIVVMPLGYGTMEVVRGGWSGLRNRDLWQANLDKFRDALLTEVLPRIEKEYRVSTAAKHRAIAGLSMGGSESLLVGLNAVERFTYIGAFSSGGLNTNFNSTFPKLDAKVNSAIRLLWISCGEQDGLITSNQQFTEWLTSKGVHYTWHKTPGQHSFRVWRRNLGDFAPLLFRD